jgi:hypothetical protein
LIESLLPCGFDTLEYSWVKATIGICMLVDYSMAEKRQQTTQDVLVVEQEDHRDTRGSLNAFHAQMQAFMAVRNQNTIIAFIKFIDIYVC